MAAKPHNAPMPLSMTTDPRGRSARRGARAQECGGVEERRRSAAEGTPQAAKDPNAVRRARYTASSCAARAESAAASCRRAVLQGAAVGVEKAKRPERQGCGKGECKAERHQLKRSGKAEMHARRAPGRAGRTECREEALVRASERICLCDLDVETPVVPWPRCACARCTCRECARRSRCWGEVCMCAPDYGNVVDVAGKESFQVGAIVGELVVNHCLGAVEARVLRLGRANGNVNGSESVAERRKEHFCWAELSTWNETGDLGLGQEVARMGPERSEQRRKAPAGNQ